MNRLDIASMSMQSFCVLCYGVGMLLLLLSHKKASCGVMVLGVSAAITGLVLTAVRATRSPANPFKQLLLQMMLRGFRSPWEGRMAYRLQNAGEILQILQSRTQACISQHRESDLSLVFDTISIAGEAGHGNNGFVLIGALTGRECIYLVAVKIAGADEKETRLNNLVSSLVLQDKCPHFPIQFAAGICKSGCNVRDICQGRRSDTYGTNVQELIVGNTFKDFVNSTFDSMNQSTYICIFFQILFSICCMENMLKLAHNDSHWENFMVTTIGSSGGYWHYVVNSQDIYLPNTGYLALMIDFGLSGPIVTPGSDIQGVTGRWEDRALGGIVKTFSPVFCKPLQAARSTAGQNSKEAILAFVNAAAEQGVDMLSKPETSPINATAWIV